MFPKESKDPPPEETPGLLRQDLWPAEGQRKPSGPLLRAPPLPATSVGQRQLRAPRLHRAFASDGRVNSPGAKDGSVGGSGWQTCFSPSPASSLLRSPLGQGKGHSPTACPTAPQRCLLDTAATTGPEGGLWSFWVSIWVVPLRRKRTPPGSPIAPPHASPGPCCCPLLGRWPLPLLDPLWPGAPALTFTTGGVSWWGGSV